MLDIGKNNGPDPKCYFTHVHLPQCIDDKQPSTKKKPFSCFLDRPFNHTVHILVSKDSAPKLAARLHKATGEVRYAKVYLKLKDLIDGDFFNQYIKSGNISLLSEGKPGVDNTFSLHDGVLRLEVDKPTYERAGLAGKPIPSPGRKHAKSRFAIELNLRLPSMVRGRKLFNRIVYAFDNALIDTVTWLFFDLRDPQLSLEPRLSNMHPVPNGQEEKGSTSDGDTNTSDAKDDTTTPRADAEVTTGKKVESGEQSAERGPTTPPIANHHPLVRDITPDIRNLGPILTPTFPSQLAEDQKDTVTDLLEWLLLAMSDCPRLREDDKVDATISRYEVPNLRNDGFEAGVGETQASSVQDLARIRYRGFLPSAIVSKILVTAIKTLSREDTWFALRVQPFSGDDCTLLVRDGKAMVWEYS